MITQTVCSSFVQQILEGVHDFRTAGGDIFKIALFVEAANLNATTTAYAATNEVVAAGYTAGGAILTNISPALSGQTGVASFATISWTANITARGALIYNTTPNGAYSNPAYMVLDFGMNRAHTAGVFTVQFPAMVAATAIVRIAAG